MTRWLSSIWQMPDLRSRVLFTLGMLAVFRLGVHIPAPGVDRLALAEWVKSTVPGDAFVSTNDADAVAWYRRIASWVLGEPRFTPAAKDELAQAADPWLVAYAGAHGMTLVTLETPAPLSRTNVKIPDVCRRFAVPWLNTFEMLDGLGAAFGWRAPA